MTEWMQERLSPKRAMAELRRHGPQLVESLPRMLARLGTDEAGASVTREELDRSLQTLVREQRRNRRVVIGATLMLGALIVFGLDGYRPVIWNGVPSISWLLAGSGLALWLSARRRGAG